MTGYRWQWIEKAKAVRRPKFSQTDCLNSAGVNGCQSMEALEIATIECENMRDSVGIHGSGKPGIMNMHAGNIALHHDSSPLPIDRCAIRQQFHALFDQGDFTVGVRNGQPKSVTLARTRYCIPELGNVLVRVIKGRSLNRQFGERSIYGLMARICTAGNAKQDIGITRQLSRSIYS